MSVASLNTACQLVGSGGVGESGAFEMLVHAVAGPNRKIVVLRTVRTSLCPNTGAIASLLVNGAPAASGIITALDSSVQAEVEAEDRVVALVHAIPLFNNVLCTRLGELEVELRECELVAANPAADGTRMLELTHLAARNWYAWNNKMPPKPDDFHVVGEVDVPNPGVDVELVPRVPQGINPTHLLMDLILTQRPGIWTQVIVTKQVRYDQVLVNSDYAVVEIFLAKKLIHKIPVDTVL